MASHNGLSLDVNRFAFIKSALDGSGGFLNGSYLRKHPREDEDKFNDRKELALYQNYLRPACERFVGYLSKKRVTRSFKHPLIEAFNADCDWKGNSLDIFMANFFIECKARGCGLLLVEKPNNQPASLEQQLTQRAFPYLTSIPPEDVRKYAINPQGQLDLLEIQSYMMIDGDLKSVLRGWDANSWWVTIDGHTVQGDTHNLGVCPVLVFSEADTFPSFGSFSQIADISKRLYNMQSELDALYRGQTFEILTYQIPPEQAARLDVSALSEAVGINNMLTYSGESPRYIGPSGESVDKYLQGMAKLEASIKDIALTIDLGNTSAAESGVALNIRFQGLNAALAAFARKAEDLERRMFDVVARWLSIQNTTTVSYPKSFELADVSAELGTLAQYQTAEFPKEVIQAKQAQIIRLDFSNLEDGELTNLVDSVYATDPETAVIDSRVALLEAKIAELEASKNASDFTSTNAGGN